MKFLIYEFWAMEGRLPCSNDQLAFNANFENPVLRSVTITDCGEVTLHYRDDIGIEDGRMILQAVAGDGLIGVELQWECWTPDFSGVEKFLPQCRFRKQPG